MTDKRNGKGITFDDFIYADVNELCSATSVPRAISGKGMSYHQYSIASGNVQFKEYKYNTGREIITALANVFDVNNNVKDRNGERTERGFVYDGFIWIQPEHVSIEVYGSGGRIFTWVPETTQELTDLIWGRNMGERQMHERVQAIQKGYLAKKQARFNRLLLLQQAPGFGIPAKVLGSAARRSRAELRLP